MNRPDPATVARRRTVKRIMMAAVILVAALLLGLLVRALVTVPQVPL